MISFSPIYTHGHDHAAPPRRLFHILTWKCSSSEPSPFSTASLRARSRLAFSMHCLIISSVVFAMRARILGSLLEYGYRGGGLG